MPRIAGTLILLTAALLSWGCDRGRGYPNRPVTIICPWATGGGTDALSRRMGSLLHKKLGANFNIINKTGGEGVTGHTAGAAAPPDGYTLTMMTAELNMLHWRKLTPVKCAHFRTLMVLNCEPAAIIVSRDAPWKTVRDLEDAIRARPGELNASGTARGGTWHLAFAGWLAKAGLPISGVKWIPTQGAGPSLKLLMAKGLDLVCCSLPEAQALIQGGNLRGLGVMADERIGGFEDVATFKEQGFDWSFVGWRALGVPSDTPESTVNILMDALWEIVKGEKFKTFMKTSNLNVSIQAGEEAWATLDEMDTEMGDLLGKPEFKDLEDSGYSKNIYPGVLGGAFLFLLAVLALRRDKPPAGKDTAPVPFNPRAWIGPAALCLSILGYVVLAETLGFILCAAVFLFVFFLFLGNRPVKSLVLAALVSCMVYQVFAVALGVDLPRALLWW